MFKQIISIHGVPRSGTSWLGQIFNSSEEVRYKFQPLFSYTFKDAIHVRSSKEEILKYYNELYNTEDEFLDQTQQIEKSIYPSFENKESNPKKLVTKMVRYHYLIPTLLSSVDDFKLVAIIRNPLAVLNSWRNAPKELPPHLSFEEEWRYAQNRNLFRPEEYFGFEKWKEATKLYLWAKEKYPKKVYLLKYEDLVSNTVDVTKDMFDFCDLTIGKQTNDFIGDSRSKMNDNPYSVYKGKNNTKEWENQLPKSVIEEVYHELTGTEFEQFLK
ncbi:sulfotransferase [Gracilibacillus suaedae]|uniref:sulfotransferase n=1 Tax=Gracilibacillus suaedae TaxID=2820273 RepID=UPI001ABDE478|nr:sulfotransferase [Gracilibacillus suaedae]